MATIKLKDIVKLKKGKKVDDFGTVFVEDSRRYIQIDDLRNDLNVKYTSSEGVQVKETDILIAWDGANAGTVGYGLSGLAGSTISCLEIHNKEFESAFVGKFLKSKFNLIRANCTGATIPHVSREYLLNLAIPRKSLEEQKKIVKSLDTADGPRQKRKEQLALLDDYLKSVFLDMFGDPVVNEKEWTMISLSQKILDVKNGLSRRRKEMQNEGDVVLRLRDIRENKIDFSESNRIRLENKEKGKYNVEIGDLLFIRVNGNPEYVGRSAVFSGYSEEVFFNDHIMRVKLDRCDVNVVFLCFLLNSSYGKRQIALYKKTSAGQHTINQEGLGKIKCYLPPLELQNKFADIVEQVEQIKQKMHASLDEMDNHFNALMQRYFG